MPYTEKGKNDYNGLHIGPETIVTRTLQVKNRFWSNVVWRAGKPALDSEWNLLSDLQAEMLGTLIRSQVPSGWLDMGENKYPAGNCGIANKFQYYSRKSGELLDVPNAVVNGWPIIVAGVNYTTTQLNSIQLSAASAVAGEYREDFVFLEVWRAQVRSRDENNVPIMQNKPTLTELYAYGNVQWAGDQIPDDIIDTAISPPTGIETSERVQIQYRIRQVAGVTFANNLGTGFTDTDVQGQGAGATPQVAGYQFTNMATELSDAGLWRAGNGDEASKNALKSVDGYTYAIPMFKVSRRTTNAWSDTGATEGDAYNNQQGNATALASLVSDRPDGKFHDGIDATDIVDLRCKVSLGKEDFDEIIEDNLHLLFTGDLASFTRKKLQYDLIATADVNGYDLIDNKGCSGKRTMWSDAETEQTDIFAKVTVSTSSSALDAYRVANTGNPWIVGDEIKIQVLSSYYPAGTVFKNGVIRPRIYVENPDKKDISSQVVWTVTSTLITATISNTADLASRNIWIYYDLIIPAGQGIRYVPNVGHRVDYNNYGSFPTTEGTVVRGERIDPVLTRYQDLRNHVYENQNDDEIFTETEYSGYTKSVSIRPLIQSTTTRDGATRALSVRATKASDKSVKLPFNIMHLKGIYTSAIAGTEVATVAFSTINPNEINIAEDWLKMDSYYICEITSLQYSATGGPTWTDIVGGTGTYYPIYTHRDITGETEGTRVQFTTTGGVLYDFTDTNLAHYRWTGRRIEVRNGSGDGYDLNGNLVVCQGAFSDEQELWVDMDYLGSPHLNAQMRLIYQYTPYQGADAGGQELRFVHKRSKGIFFNNGSGGGTVMIDATGTSNAYYTPMSPRLPAEIDVVTLKGLDYRQDGQNVELKSIGNMPFDTDAIFSASYDISGYFGGAQLRPGLLSGADYTMPISPASGSRGYLSTPFVEAVFEAPEVDRTYAEFILPFLAVDKATREVYLFIQVGNITNKGIHVVAVGNVRIEIIRLNERLLLL